MIIEGSVNALAFEAYVEHILAPSLSAGQIVVLDSPVYKRIASGSMPPPEVTVRLTDAEKASIKLWIESGAGGVRRRHGAVTIPRRIILPPETARPVQWRVFRARVAQAQAWQMDGRSSAPSETSHPRSPATPPRRSNPFRRGRRVRLR